MPASTAAKAHSTRHTPCEWFMVSLIVVGVVIRLFCLGQRPLWDDEAFTYFVSHRGVVGLFEVLRYDAQPPLFYALETISLGLFGHSELALRLPSLLAGIALIAVVYRIASQLWERQAGLLAGALVAICPLLIYQSVEARSYSLLSLLLLSSAWYYRRHALNPAWSTGLAAAILGILAVYTHYFGVFVLFFGALTLVGRPWKTLPRIAAPLLLNAAGVLTLMPLLKLQQQQHGAKQFHPDGSIVTTVVRSFLVMGTGGYPEGLVKAGAAALFLLVTLIAYWGLIRNRDLRKNAGFALLLSGTVFVLLHVGLLLGRWPVRDSYLSLASAPFLMLLAAGLVRLPVKGLTACGIALAVAAMAAGDLPLLKGPAHANPDFRWASQQLESRQPGAVLLARPWGDLACFAYYTGAKTRTAVFGIDSKEQFTEEALVVGRELSTPRSLVGSAPRICVLGKTSGSTGFQVLGQALTSSGYTQREDLRHQDIELQTWERPATR